MSHLSPISLVLTRVGGFFIIWVGLWCAIAFPLFRKYAWRPFRPIAADQKLKLLVPLYLLAPVIVWGAQRATEQSWRSIGMDLTATSGRSLLYGWGLAVTGLLAILLVKRGCHLVTFRIPAEINRSMPTRLRTAGIVLGFVPLALWLSGIEELVFRGWLQTQLDIAWSPFVAAMLGSGVFAIAHLIWDGQAGLKQQPGLFALGLVLVLARWVDDGNLALAWGLHAGWVWSLACLGEFIQPQPVAEKPVWLTGSTAQPLTDIFDLGLMAVTAGLIWVASSGLG